MPGSFAVRILLIAEQDIEHRMMERLVQGMDEAHQLLCCRADPKALTAIDIQTFHILIWGRISAPLTARSILAELNRQQAAAPIIILADTVPAHADAGAIARGESDILLRSALNPQVLKRAFEFVLEKDGGGKVEPGSDTKADPLTGLSNRQQFHEELTGMLKASSAPESIALLLIDVDQFKKVNASYGQGAGDVLIQLIADRIRTCLVAGQCIARVGGNEFAVTFCNDTGSVEEECRASLDRI